MMLRYFPDDELKELLNGWKIDELKTLIQEVDLLSLTLKFGALTCGGIEVKR